jgi:hypothetical protein
MRLELNQVHLLWPFIGLLHQPWMIDGDDCGAISGMNEWQGKRKCSEETGPSITVSITDRTLRDQGSNPGCRCGRTMSVLRFVQLKLIEIQRFKLDITVNWNVPLLLHTFVILSMRRGLSVLVARCNGRVKGLLKNAVFWDVTPCGSCKNRRVGGT